MRRELPATRSNSSADAAMMRFVTSVRIPLRVQSSARQNELLGFREGVLIVRVTAPAIEGRANESLCRLLAKQCRVPTSAVTIVRGHRSRDKLIQIDGLDRPTLLEALAK
jgi:uncharacterized protein (TIGR00251 family)